MEKLPYHNLVIEGLPMTIKKSISSTDSGRGFILIDFGRGHDGHAPAPFKRPALQMFHAVPNVPSSSSSAISFRIT